jgi:hypothetical protein
MIPWTVRFFRDAQILFAPILALNTEGSALTLMPRRGSTPRNGCQFAARHGPAMEGSDHRLR